MLIPTLVVAVPSFAYGFTFGRYWTLPVPAILIGLFYWSLAADLWGAGLGDGWYYPMALLMIAGTIAVTAGVIARALVRAARRTDTGQTSPTIR